MRHRITLGLCISNLSWLCAQPGSVDLTFSAGGGTDANIFAVFALEDGDILIGGAFQEVQGTTRPGIARLNADGSLDPGFAPEIGSGPIIYALAVDVAGRIIVGGYIYDVPGYEADCILRLLPDGTIDTSFDPGSGADYSVESISLDEGGDIYVGGNFHTIDGIGRMGVARLNEDGGLDSGFDPGGGFQWSGDPGYPYVSSLTVQSDQRLLVCGGFDLFNGGSVPSVVRLNSDGSIDPIFAPQLTQDGYPAGTRSILVQPDQRIVVNGGFDAVNGSAITTIARLLPDGSLDNSFNTPTGPDDLNANPSIALEPSGRLVVCGHFNSWNGIPSRSAVRLEADGTVDGSFQTADGVDDDPYWIYATTVMANGRILVAGNFTSFNGHVTGDIALLDGGCAINWYFDQDGDGYGDPVISVLECDAPNGYVPGGVFDCNDNNDALFPGAPCDDSDPLTINDQYDTSCVCAGQFADCLGVAGGNALPGTWCDDGNLLTWNDLWSSECLCAGTAVDCQGIPDGIALPGTQCDDGVWGTLNDLYQPDCNCQGVDCDGVLGGSNGALAYYPDVDGDGFGDASGTVVWACVVPAGHVRASNLNDCDDGDPLAYPGAPCDDGDPLSPMDLLNGECICLPIFLVAADTLRPSACGGVRPVDLDQDGDQDLLLQATSALCWLENMDGLGNFAPADTLVVDDNWMVRIVDIDGDGDNDLVYLNGQEGVSAALQTAEPGIFAPPIVIWTESPGQDFMFLATGDIDGDGMIDLCFQSLWSSEIQWVQNGFPLFTGPIPLVPDFPFNWSQRMWLLDVEPDGDTDLLIASSDSLILARNVDGVGTVWFWEPLLEFSGWNMTVIDVDQDGDPDLASAGYGCTWIENDGGDSFDTHYLFPGENCHFGNMDCDGDVDAFGITTNWTGEMLLWVNLTGNADFGDPVPLPLWFPTIIDSPNGNTLADLNGDGLQDYLLWDQPENGDCDILWYRNEAFDFATLELPWDTITVEAGSVVLYGGSPAGGVYAGPGVNGSIIDPLVAGTGWHTIIYQVDLPLCTDIAMDSMFIRDANTLDCLGVPGGSALPGTGCDDGQNATVFDAWTNGCECVGISFPIDCLGIPDGLAMPGTPCDDGLLFTTDDQFDIACDCIGRDCAEVLGGDALPGTPCDDGDQWTYNDLWTVDCDCNGVVGIEESEGHPALQVIPNPSDGHLQLLTQSMDISYMEVLDARGRVVFTGRNILPSGVAILLDLSRLTGGCYTVRVGDGSSNRQARLILIR